METSYNLKITVVLSLCLITVSGLAQKPRFKEKKIAKNVVKHITYLADDKLGGRASGTEGEELSAKYIAEEFRKLGLQELGDDGYLQLLGIPDMRIAQSNTSLKIGDQVYTLFKEFYPISISSNNGLFKGDAINVKHGIVDPSLDTDNYKGYSVSGKTVLIKVETPEADNPHSKYTSWSGFERRTKLAKARGAKAVIFYTANKDNYPTGELKKTLSHAGLPVLFLKKDLSSTPLTKVDLQLDVLLLTKNAYNVVGYINNNSKNTVVIGAHHDHLGHGEIQGSLDPDSKEVHNGADDNASGVAGVIELARIVKKKPKKFSNNNYLFIAFTGEEMGLVGSKFFLDHLPKNQEITSFNYMINMDMIGKLDSTQKTLVINGVGTSPAWTSTMDAMKFSKRKIASVKTTESGIGASDHSSFYINGIPAVHFFTGQHAHYHKPSDDIEIVNFGGEAFVISYICQMMQRMDKLGKVEFTKTKDIDRGKMKFKVTLGVMPDYIYDGEGMRIDGVRQDKPADNAGLVKGDIVIVLNGQKINNMQDYMKALTSIKPGDKTDVTINRNGEIISKEIQF